MQTALRDVDGAINYIIEGAKTHPNRIDENFLEETSTGGRPNTSKTKSDGWTKLSKP